MIGGWIKKRTPAEESGIVPYIYVDDIARVVADALVSGGGVVEPVRAECDLVIAQVRASRAWRERGLHG